MAKTARSAARYFAVRQAWKVWKDRLEDLRRQQQLKRILIAKKKAIFDGASIQNNSFEKPPDLKVSLVKSISTTGESKALLR